jgi:hypothetical protein
MSFLAWMNPGVLVAIILAAAAAAGFLTWCCWCSKYTAREKYREKYRTRYRAK